MATSDFNLSPSDAHPETMDFLSLAWCNFAVQSLQPEPQNGPILLDSPMKQLKTAGSPNCFPKSARMDDADDFMSFPPLKSNDVKSWLWMQQAMHPELNYNSCLRKKWMPWKQIIPLKSVSIKKWVKEIKLRRKEDQRLQRAEEHAAISIAGVAAALAAIAAEKSKKESNEDEDRDAALASAAALVASQCAKVAETIGAKKEQLSSVIGSAISGTTTSDILTLTAAATTSLKGAATLKARSECKNRLYGGVSVLPIEDNDDFDFDFKKGRFILAQGAKLYVETPEGKYRPRSVSVILNTEAKVVLMTRKHNLFKSKKESTVMKQHAELYKGGSKGDDGDMCYLIVLTTKGGIFKLDMASDYRLYKTWATTINRMLKISTSFE